MAFSVNRLVVSLFLILLLGSLVFYLERMLFVDASFIAFRIINMNSLQIQEHRYGSFITQAFPLIGARLHLPLKYILILYSASFNLFYLVVAWLLATRFRQLPLAILMSLYFVLFVSDNFFWTNNEIHQGIAWMFLTFGMLLYSGVKKWSFIPSLVLFSGLAFLSIFTHPLVIFPFVFLWIFLITRKDWPFPLLATIALSAVIVWIATAKFMMSFSHGYDAGKLENTSQLDLYRIKAALTSEGVKQLIRRTVWNYWLIPLIFISGVVYALRLKKYFHVLLTIGAAAAIAFALCLVYSDFLPFYSESEWMPFSIIVSALFVYYVLPALSNRSIILCLSFIFLVRLSYIGFVAPKWVQRREWIAATLSQMKEQNISKALIHETEENKRVLIMNWGAPTESILYSKLLGDSIQRTFVVGTPENLAGRLPNDTNLMIGCFDFTDDGSLNHSYFRFDTHSDYRLFAPVNKP